MRCKGTFVFIFAFMLAVFFTSFASASFNFSESGSSMFNQSEISGYLEANINISFYNESLNSTFNDSLGHSIKLGVLLGRVYDYNYKFNDSTNTTVDSGFQILKFDNANFSMPKTAGNITYQLNFSKVQIFKKTISITSTKSLVKAKIDEKYTQLNSAKTSIKTYDLFIQKILNEFLNMTSLEYDLKKVETQYTNAKTEGEYKSVLQNFSYIKMPETISETVNANSITFYPKREIINLDVLMSIGEGDYGENVEGYTDAIYSWNEQNLETKVSFMEILINYETGAAVTLRIFQFKFDKRNMKNDSYFIIEDIGNLKFEGNILPMRESGYHYISLYDISDSITFSTTDNFNFISIPVFISPALYNLRPINVGPYPPGEEDNKLSKWLLFGLILFLLILVAVIVYIILQNWYRREYENYLFKNRNNLYNIMTYIQTAKKSGMERDNILKNLKKSGWTGEQINYAIRKYEGKKILGIIEKPFKKVIEDIDSRPK